MSYHRSRTLYPLGQAVSVDLTPSPEDVSPKSSSTAQDTVQGPGGAQIGGGMSPGASMSNWKNIGGVCYATNESFLADMKSLQRQVNRLADSPISVDGQIGPLTLKAMAGLAPKGVFKYMNNPSLSCDNVCSQIYTFIAAIQLFADNNNVSSSVSSPAPAETPTYYDPQSGQLQQQGVAGSVGDLWKNMSSTQQMLVGGAAVAVGLYAYQQAKKSKRKAGRR